MFTKRGGAVVLGEEKFKYCEMWSSFYSTVAKSVYRIIDIYKVLPLQKFYENSSTTVQ